MGDKLQDLKNCEKLSQNQALGVMNTQLLGGIIATQLAGPTAEMFGFEPKSPLGKLTLSVTAMTIGTLGIIPLINFMSGRPVTTQPFPPYPNINPFEAIPCELIKEEEEEEEE